MSFTQVSQGGLEARDPVQGIRGRLVDVFNCARERVDWAGYDVGHGLDCSARAQGGVCISPPVHGVQASALLSAESVDGDPRAPWEVEAGRFLGRVLHQVLVGDLGNGPGISPGCDRIEVYCLEGFSLLPEGFP